ncbi:MAG: SDR family NAD(P)-dependent oxidoreductase [Candidatus Promineifilaceae bacterium]
MTDKYYEAKPQGSANKTVLITGATGAIGKAIARQIAAMDGHTAVLAARDEAKARQAVSEISKATGNEDVYYELVDVSRRASIDALAGRWPGRLDVLINNAGVTPRRREETPEGIEMLFATNVLGYFWMTQAFAEILRQSAPARVVNVASYWAGDLELDDLEFKRRRYRNGRAYRQSKQANRMLTVAFAGRFDPAEVTVNVCHPGDVNSKLSNDLGFGGSESPDSGARTPVWLATDPAVAQETGKYFEHMRQTPDRFASDRQAIEALYEACLSY